MKLLDIARGAYVRSPAPVRRAMAPIVSLAPTALKYGGAYRQMRRAITASADPATADRQQLAALRQLVGKAREGSGFWRARIDAALGRTDITTFTRDDLSRLPVLTKAELAAAGTEALAVPQAQLDLSTTSGSNGEQPFAFWRDKDRSVREIAFVNHIWSRTGYREGDAKAVLRGFRLDDRGSIDAWDPALRELKLSVFPMTERDVSRYVDLIDWHGVRYLNSYPSALEVFCRILLRIGRRPKVPLRGIFPISEPIYAHQRQAIRAALGDVPVVPFYGLSEKTAFAGEVPDTDDVYEFEPLYGLAELVDDAGQPIREPGREGRLVGTGFISTGMPFIRYDSQDHAVLVRPASAANGWRLRVRRIQPRRKPDFLVGRDGRRIVTTDFTPEEPTFFRSIRQLQFVQERPGEAVIRYVPSAEATAGELESMRAELERKAEGHIAFALEQADTLAASENGKHAFIDQRLV